MLTLVLIESPFAAHTPERRALHDRYLRAALRDSLNRGEAPFASHALYPLPGVLDDDVPEERERGIAAGLAWGTCASRTVVYWDLGVTRGMKQGIARAAAEGRPIDYRKLPPAVLDRVRAGW